jgi:hypothetical protein
VVSAIHALPERVLPAWLPLAPALGQQGSGNLDALPVLHSHERYL